MYFPKRDEKSENNLYFELLHLKKLGVTFSLYILITFTKTFFFCFITVSKIEGCYHYKIHSDLWRNINSNMSIQPANISCDINTLKYGWHRFVGTSGTQLHTRCPNSRNKCGTVNPGWIIGKHPDTAGEGSKNTLHFRNLACGDVFGSVVIRNCGNFFTYKFTKFPTWFCSYGVCTV